ncbi:NAD-dependent epimerase/dehydratase family protein [Azospirillum sp. TSO22-1]|uniref:NAD-dependent epimerase/dehydratase family protein n=1 Tax=Azospirillum sp. TSO22-1 TaxID=716789 RepID=UPI000D608185|nr:NAD-dependent epimerase/dehydratase family protein [Azospirillum sp. TSO22-1]PWC52987.1 NAD-dependent dehydratase [Azospirillum sp. TSO22-1]
MKKALVLGAGGFIGGHLVERLKREGFWVRGVDLARPSYEASAADDFVVADLRDPGVCGSVVDAPFDEVYQLAADMGGAGYIFTGRNDADILHNSAVVNLNVVEACHRRGVGRLFYSSSACVYPQENQTDTANPLCREDTAYPANPDSDYGWEKLFSERLYLAYARNHGVPVRIARYHNIFGPLGAWDNGREKAPAAICRKVAQAEDGGEIEIWGDGQQTRTFLYIDECLEGTLRLARSDVTGPVNIGSEEMVSINDLVDLVAGIAGKRLRKRHVPGPQGVRGRRSDNTLIRRELGWAPERPLRHGLERTYRWIAEQVAAGRKDA